MTLVFDKIINTIPSTQAFLIHNSETIAVSPSHNDPHLNNLEFSGFERLHDVFLDDPKEIYVCNQLKADDPVFEIIQPVFNQTLDGSQWMVIQIRGFEEYLLIIYRSSENMVFQHDDIGLTENVLIEVANARENRQHFTLDLNSNCEIQNS